MLTNEDIHTKPLDELKTTLAALTAREEKLNKTVFEIWVEKGKIVSGLRERVKAGEFGEEYRHNWAKFIKNELRMSTKTAYWYVNVYEAEDQEGKYKEIRKKKNVARGRHREERNRIAAEYKRLTGRPTVRRGFAIFDALKCTDEEQREICLREARRAWPGLYRRIDDEEERAEMKKSRRTADHLPGRR